MFSLRKQHDTQRSPAADCSLVRQSIWNEFKLRPHLWIHCQQPQAPTAMHESLDRGTRNSSANRWRSHHAERRQQWATVFLKDFFVVGVGNQPLIRRPRKTFWLVPVLLAWNRSVLRTLLERSSHHLFWNWEVESGARKNLTFQKIEN